MGPSSLPSASSLGPICITPHALHHTSHLTCPRPLPARQWASTMSPPPTSAALALTPTWCPRCVPLITLMRTGALLPSRTCACAPSTSHTCHTLLLACRASLWLRALRRALRLSPRCVPLTSPQPPPPAAALLKSAMLLTAGACLLHRVMLSCRPERSASSASALA